MIISKNDIGNMVSFFHIDKSYLYFGKILNLEYKNNELVFLAIETHCSDTVYCFNENIFNVTLYDFKTYSNWKKISKFKINQDIDRYIEEFLIGRNPYALNHYKYFCKKN